MAQPFPTRDSARPAAEILATIGRGRLPTTRTVRCRSDGHHDQPALMRPGQLDPVPPLPEGAIAATAPQYRTMLGAAAILVLAEGDR
jgi:hypothetical protein